jgi:hypothetical protein
MGPLWGVVIADDVGSGRRHASKCRWHHRAAFLSVAGPALFCSDAAPAPAQSSAPGAVRSGLKLGPNVDAGAVAHWPNNFLDWLDQSPLARDESRVFVDPQRIAGAVNTVRFAFDSGNDYVGTVSGYTFNSDLCEVPLSKRKLTAAERQRVDSDLAIKYGTILGQTTPTSYLDSSGAVVWDATASAGCINHIAGIRRGDLSALSQPQSRSLNSASNFGPSLEANAGVRTRSPFTSLNQSGKNLQATQATAANQPTLVSGATNFNPALNVNGTSHQLDLSSIASFGTIGPHTSRRRASAAS